MLALHFLILWMTGKPILSPEKSVKAIHSFSILGPSLFYAAFTGVLLWVSSLAGGWAGNWSACNHIASALATERRWVRALGPSRAARFALFWERNIGGFASNISFGFMLGIIPELAAFAGIPLDIRHVTLSASFLTTSVATLGVGALATKEFMLAALGIAGIGLMNLAVSFSLALFVATRACDIQSPDRNAIYAAVARRALHRPFSFLLPTETPRPPEAVPQS
jgi:site-specific recombinase